VVDLSKKIFRRDEIVGKEIISDAAVRLGKVKDIGYDQDGKIVLIYDKQEGEEDAIQSSQIIALGDIVLVKSAQVAKPPAQPQKSETALKYCPKCGKASPPEMQFCTACGTRLGG
jgi:sporulation protein YlmC with PRC-barrel domain